MTAAPAALVAAPAVVPASSAVAAQNVMLAGLIADIYNDIEAVVAEVVYGVSDVIGGIPGWSADRRSDRHPLLLRRAGGGRHGVLGGRSGDSRWSTSISGRSRASRKLSVQRRLRDGRLGRRSGRHRGRVRGGRIDYFFGWIPNIPEHHQRCHQHGRDVINWIIGWIPGRWPPLRRPAPRPRLSRPRGCGGGRSVAESAVARRRPLRPAAGCGLEAAAEARILDRLPRLRPRADCGRQARCPGRGGPGRG